MKELRLLTTRLRPLHHQWRPLNIRASVPVAAHRPCFGRQYSTSPPPSSRRGLGRLPKLLVFTGTIASVVWYTLSPSAPQKTLNTTRFVPYTVLAKEPVSPNSFILTVRPAEQPNTPLPYLQPDGSWWDFQWSVQVKQPELQIQREYTPLPPLPSTQQQGKLADDDGALRLYVRKVNGGEVSTYLSKMDVGSRVELRLGERGYAFNYLTPEEKDDIVCLAGGTGIATAIQIAHTALSKSARVHQDTKVHILWAVRSRSDIQTGPPARRPKSMTPLSDQARDLTAIARQLADMKKVYGDKLAVTVAVDEEGIFIGEPDLRDVLGIPPRAKASRDKTTIRYPFDLPPVVAAACQENAPIVPEKPHPGSIPTNLRKPVFVCGPDGFVDKFAGSLERDPGTGKICRQGGLLGALNAKYGDPAAPWLVLGFP